MGITRDGRHKKSKTGGNRNKSQKKRKNMLGRQPSNTKIGEERVKNLRVRGGNFKSRALRLSSGNFTFHSTGSTFLSEITEVIYHPSNNELVRTNTLTKSSVIKVSAAGFAEDVKTVSAIDKPLASMASKGFLLAIITSRPGQEGVANGYILQGKELEFYLSKLKKKKSGLAGIVTTTEATVSA